MLGNKFVKFVLCIFLGVFIITGFAFSVSSKEKASKKKLKVAFVYPTPVGDAGWTYQHDLGRVAVNKTFGNKVETKFIENVSDGASERVIRDLAKTGYDLIFTTSFGYMNPTLRVAKSFPKTKFAHASGYKRAENVATYLCRFYEGRYLTGLVAGKMTKSNIIGYVAAFPIPEVIRGINAFTIGAKKVNPNIKVKVVWVNTWFDPGKEREATMALIDQGADVLTHNTDSTAPTIAAQEKGVYIFASHSDMSKYGKDAHLTASTDVWTPYYVQTVKDVLNNTWKSTNIWGGIKHEMVKLTPFNKKVPKDVIQSVEKATDMIKKGLFHPFQGPIKNQKGEIIVKSGKHLSDKEILEMNYYVQGVLGKIPK